MTFQIVVDWDKNGNFTGTYDDITADVWDGSQIACRLGIRPYMTIADESTLSFQVDNRARKYSPEYASSPLFGKLLPGRPVRLYFNDMILWTGVIDEIKPEPFRYGGNTADISCVGLKKTLDAFEIYPELYENTTVDTAIIDIVTRIAVPPATPGVWLAGVPGFSEAGVSTFASDVSAISDLDTGATEFPFIGDNFHTNARSDSTENSTGRKQSPVSAYQFLKDLMENERGKLFFDREGKVVFWSRHHLLNDFEPDLIFNNNAHRMEYISPLANVINYIEAKCYPRVVDTEPSTIFELVNPRDATMRGIRIPAGSWPSMEFEFRNAAGQRISAKDISNPVAGLDAQFEGATPEMLFFIYAQKIHVEFDNRANSEAATLVAFIVEGKTVTSTQTLTVIAQDTDSIAQYGKRPFTLDLKMVTDPDKAKALAEYELSRRSVARGAVTQIGIRRKNSIIGNEGSDAYRAKVSDGLIMYLPLNDDAGATTIEDISPESNDATNGGATFSNAVAPVAGERMPSFDGNDYIDLYSAGFNTDFDPAVGSVAFWFQPNDETLWQDANFKYLFRLLADGNNVIQIYKNNDPANWLVFEYVAGGTYKAVVVDLTEAQQNDELKHVAMTWDTANDRLMVYLDGVQQGATVTGLGTWAGNLNQFATCLGAALVDGTFGWEGWMSHLRIYDRAINPLEVAHLATQKASYYLGFGMGDLVKVIDDQTSHETRYHIVSEVHRIDVDSKMVETTWELEPADTQQYWLAGVPGFSEAGVTTYGGH